MKSVEEIIKGNLKLVKSMLEDGKTDKEIYEELEISKSTWKKYKAECLELKEVIAEVKDNRNHEVEESLFKLCKGYHYYEEVPTKVKVEVQGENGTVLTKEHVEVVLVKKFRGAELAAQKYWLNNKKSAHWKDDPNKVKNDREVIKIKKQELERNKINI